MKFSPLLLVKMVSKFFVYGVTVQVLFLQLVVAENGSAQKAANVKNVEITCMNSQPSLDEFFTEIETKTDFRFSYDKRHLRDELSQQVQVPTHQAKVSDLLLEVSRQIKIGFRQVNNSINVRKITLLENPLQIVDPKDQEVSGVVRDEENQPLPGVTVLEKGTSNGTITDIDGQYTLAVDGSESVLVFSYIGYVTQEMVVGNQSEIFLKMRQDLQTLEEVVVVAYGTQRKINLTGSVADVGSKELHNRPVTKLSQSLAGQMTGVTVLQNSGEPGEDGGFIRIRGVSNFKQNSYGGDGKADREQEGGYFEPGFQPLVIVDGIPASMDEIDPNTVESISVLKDAASAAIYGARAANGVILVTTRRGREGTMEVNYNPNFGWASPSEFPKFVDSWVYAEAVNERAANMGQQPEFSPEQIQQMRDGVFPYGNGHHLEDLFNSGSGFQMNHNLNFRGGSEYTQYSASMSYLKQNGLIDENVFDRYNLQLNLDQKVSEKLNLQTSIFWFRSENNEPITSAGHRAGVYWDGASVRALQKAAWQLPTYYPLQYPDGTYSRQNTYNWKAWLDSDSFGKTNEHNFLGNIGLTYDILDDLKISGKAGYRNVQTHRKSFNATFEFTPDFITGPNRLREERAQIEGLTLQALLEYDKTFGQHNVSGMLGYSQEEQRSDSYWMYREDFPSNDLTVIDAGSAAIQLNSGSAKEWALRSLFGRIRYSYADRYLFEANGRYDGSSRFHKDYRYGFFPSFSAGWIISNEDFFNVSWVSRLKVRASWGEMGNQDIGEYPYQQSLSLGEDYVFGDAIQPGITVRTLANRVVSWETTRISDVGVDVSFLNNKLSLTVDYFNKKTKDVLYNIDAAALLGLTPSEQNAGEVLNRGWEFLLSYRDNVGDFYYSITPNLSTLHNEVLSLANVDQVISRYGNDFYMIMAVGQPVHAFYGYESDGLFVDQADIDGYAVQNRPVEPGDVRNKDISGPNGVPDGIVDPTYDRTVLGSRYPDVTFGSTFTANYKGIDFSLLVQGMGGVNGILTRQNAWPLQGRALMEWQLDRWTPENPNPNATVPRYTTGNVNTREATGFWTQDAGYVRIKDVQIGYTFPEEMTSRINIRTLRVYFSGRNLITWDSYYKGIDPEALFEDDGRYYPPTKVLAMGLNLKF